MFILFVYREDWSLLVNRITVYRVVQKLGIRVTIISSSLIARLYSSSTFVGTPLEAMQAFL